MSEGIEDGDDMTELECSSADHCLRRQLNIYKHETTGFNVTRPTLLVATKPVILMRCQDSFLLVGGDRARSAKI